MDAIELLEYQHRAFEQLFDRIEAAPHPGSDFERLADDLAVHAQLEERVLYPETADLRTADELQEAFVAHEEVKRLLADLLSMPADDASFRPGLRLLRESIQQHVQDEETELFQATRAAFDAKRLAQLGQRMEALARELEEEEGPPREHFVATNRELQSAG